MRYKILQISGFAGVIALATVAVAPATAQKSAMEPGNVWETVDVRIEPGHTQQYLDYLKAKYQDECDWNISKGYYIACHVLENAYKRRDEPDLVLVRVMKDWESNAERKRHSDEFMAHANMDAHSIDTDGGSRTPIRKIGDVIVWREMNFTK